MNPHNPHPLSQLKLLEEESESSMPYSGTARWMIPYADFLTLLLGFCLIMYALIAQNNEQSKASPTKPDAVSTTEEINAKNQALNKQTLEAENNRQDWENILEKEIGLTGDQLEVRQDKRGLVISLQERIFFEPGQATLSPEAEKTVAKLANILKKTSQSIRVEGHTDTTPIKTATFPSNWELSTARSVTILKILIEKHQFSPTRLSAAGYGEFYPLANNSTIEGKQKNRRVDIVLLNPLLEPGSTKQDILKPSVKNVH